LASVTELSMRYAYLFERSYSTTRRVASPEEWASPARRGRGRFEHRRQSVWWVGPHAPGRRRNSSSLRTGGNPCCCARVSLRQRLFWRRCFARAFGHKRRRSRRSLHRGVGSRLPQPQRHRSREAPSFPKSGSPRRASDRPNRLPPPREESQRFNPRLPRLLLRPPRPHRLRPTKPALPTWLAARR